MQADTIVINATSGDDVIVIAGDASGVTISGLGYTLNITGFEAANDRIIINGLAGDDVIQASGLAAGAIQLRPMVAMATTSWSAGEGTTRSVATRETTY